MARGPCRSGGSSGWSAPRVAAPADPPWQWSSRSEPGWNCIEMARLSSPTAFADARSLRSAEPCLLAAMDLRVVLVAAPIVLAASWAVFHIGRAAVGQLQLMLKRARA